MVLVDIHAILEQRLTGWYGPPRANDSGRTWRLRAPPLYLDVVLSPRNPQFRSSRMWVFDPSRIPAECAKCFRVETEAKIDKALADLRAWLGMPLPPSEVIEGVLETAMHVSGANFGDAKIFEPATGVLRLFAHRNLPERFLERFQTVRPAIDNTVCARAFRRGMPHFVVDVLEDHAYRPYRSLAREVGFRAVHAIPIMTDEVVAGMVSCLFAKPCEPREDALEEICKFIQQNDASLRACMHIHHSASAPMEDGHEED